MTLRERVDWRWTVPLGGLVAVLSYLEFVVLGPPRAYDIVAWALVVPVLLAHAVEGWTDHPWHLPSLYGMLLGVGVLRFLDGHPGIVTLTFIGGGVAGLVDWTTPGTWFARAG